MVSICPNCGSTDIEFDSSPTGFATGQMKICQKCGHTSPMFPEIEKDQIEEFKKEFEKDNEPIKESSTEKVDVRYGSVLLVLWKIGGILAVILGSIFIIASFVFSAVSEPLRIIGVTLLVTSLIQLLIVYKKQIASWIKK